MQERACCKENFAITSASSERFHRIRILWTAVVIPSVWHCTCCQSGDEFIECLNKFRYERTAWDVLATFHPAPKTSSDLSDHIWSPAQLFEDSCTKLHWHHVVHNLGTESAVRAFQESEICSLHIPSKDTANQKGNLKLSMIASLLKAL